MNKRAVSLGRILLAVGTSLSFLVVVEAHQKMVDARSISSNAIASVNSTRQASVVPPALVPQPTPQQNSQTIPQTTPSASGTVAMSTGAPGAAAQGVSQVAPTQIAANEWSGASFPVEQFQSYTSPFGYRRSIDGYNYNEFHYGLDMAAPRGSYIRNWWGGTVVEVSDDSNCGTSVVVESGNWLHIYCHMEGHVEVDRQGRRYMVDRDGGLQIYENSEVQAGQRIGRVGMSGRTTGPHLHWGLKYSNNWVDPALVLRAMYGGQQSNVSYGRRSPNPTATN